MADSGLCMLVSRDIIISIIIMIKKKVRLLVIDNIVKVRKGNCKIIKKSKCKAKKRE